MDDRPDRKTIRSAMLDATRHDPDAFDLALDAEGFLPIEDFVYGFNLVSPEGEIDAASVQDVLTTGGFRYFDFDNENEKGPTRFRALRGHTTDRFDYPMEEAPLSLVFYYLVPAKDREHVEEHGLEAVRKKYLPLETSEDDAMATASKRRIGNPVLLQIDSCAPQSFYHYCNRWYCQHVDPYYIQVIEA